jgi:hypothetical protein
VASQLTYKQKLFIEAYLGESNGNATDAARRAGYSEHAVTGSRDLLKNPKIQARIQARVASAAMAANEVLARLGDVAAADITEFLDIKDDDTWKLSLKRVKRKGKGHLIRKIKMTRDGPEIELEARLPALIQLGAYHGPWNRDAPPEVSLVELAKRLKEKHEQLRGDGHTDGPVE